MNWRNRRIYCWKSNLFLGRSGAVTREDLVHVVKFYWIEVGCIVSRSSLLGRLDMTAWSCKRITSMYDVTASKTMHLFEQKLVFFLLFGIYS